LLNFEASGLGEQELSYLSGNIVILHTEEVKKASPRILLT